MKCLDMKSTNLELDKTIQTVTEWTKTFGKDLKGIVIGDAGDPLLGTCEAIVKAKREDIIRVTTGDCKLSLDYMKNNQLHAIAWQAPESDGALPIEVAIDWFNGLDILPVKYLPAIIITKETVNNYYPAQW
jgi:ABC-type sugar transport system substrate-binding protein